MAKVISFECGPVLRYAVLITIASLFSVLGEKTLAEPQVPDHAPDRVLVRFKPETPVAAKARARAEVGASPSHVYRLVPGLEVLTVPAAPQGVEMVLSALSRNPNVEYAEPDYVVEAVGTTPNDPRFGELWGMSNIGAPAAWDISQGDPNIAVAIIDTGIDYEHPDLAANIWTNPGEVLDGHDNDGNGYVDDLYGYDFVNNDADPFDDNSHGSHVAGTVGALGDNSVGVVGVNWNIQLMALKILNASGSGYTSDAIRALEYAVDKGVRVSNNSWGNDPYSESLSSAIAAAQEGGHLFVAAAGNGASDNDSAPNYPSSYDLDNIIAVAAIDPTDQLWEERWWVWLIGGSNYGAATVDLAAPGAGILSTVPNSGYSSKTGTSMAAPHVAGAAAMLYGGCEGLGYSYSDVRDLLLGSTRLLSSLTGKTATGGTLDLAQAVSDAKIDYGCFAADTPPIVALTDPKNGATVSGTITVTADASDDDAVSQVEFFVDSASDSAPIGTDSDASDGWSASWDTTSYDDGAYSITAIATDTASQEGSHSVTVTVDNIDSAPIADAGADQTVIDSDGSSNEWVTLDGSGSSDDGPTLSYVWTEGSQQIASGVTPTVLLTVGDHVIDLTVTDVAGQTAEDSVTITVQAAPEGVTATVDRVSVTGHGGRQGNKHVDALVSVTDSSGADLAGASVAGELYRDDSVYGTSTGTTDSLGDVMLFEINNAPSGCYHVVVTDVVATGAIFDGATPEHDPYCK